MKKSAVIDVARPEVDLELFKQGPNWVGAGVPAPRQAPGPDPWAQFGQVGPLPDSHLASLETIRETATPGGRAWGVFVRLLPWLIPWLAICAGILYLLDDPLIPLLIFAGLTAVTVYGLNRQDYAHSAAGVERHKADLAHDLAVQKEDNAQVLRKTALAAYIRRLDGAQ